MHLSLSDLLTCPRCGPGYGLILLPHEVRDRRVVSGVLGCPNCRERYPIHDRQADLRVPGSGGERVGEAEEPGGGGMESDREQAIRLAALMGLGDQPGTVLMAGPAAGHAAGVAALAGAIEVMVENPVPQGVATPEGVSPVRLGEGIPVRPHGLQAVVLSGERVALVEAAAAAIRVGGRLVLEGGLSEEVRGRVREAGLRVLVEESGTLVAERTAGASGARGPIA